MASFDWLDPTDTAIIVQKSWIVNWKNLRKLEAIRHNQRPGAFWYITNARRDIGWTMAEFQTTKQREDGLLGKSWQVSMVFLFVGKFVRKYLGSTMFAKDATD